MKTILKGLRQRPAIFSALVFLLMILPAVLLFLAAELDSRAGISILLGLVILANLIALIPVRSR